MPLVVTGACLDRLSERFERSSIGRKDELLAQLPKVFLEYMRILDIATRHDFRVALVPLVGLNDDPVTRKKLGTIYATHPPRACRSRGSKRFRMVEVREGWYRYKIRPRWQLWLLPPQHAFDVSGKDLQVDHPVLGHVLTPFSRTLLVGRTRLESSDSHLADLLEMSREDVASLDLPNLHELLTAGQWLNLPRFDYVRTELRGQPVAEQAFWLRNWYSPQDVTSWFRWVYHCLRYDNKARVIRRCDPYDAMACRAAMAIYRIDLGYLVKPGR